MVRLIPFLLLVLLPWGVFGAPAGLFSLEGDVTVARNGVLIPSEKVAEGFPLEAFDTVTTGATGRAEVRLSPSTGITGTVRLDPSTSVYLDITPWKSQQVAGVELLAGGVTVRVTAVNGASSLEVRTEVATFGAGISGFRTLVSGAGDVLTEAINGKVACVADGRTASLDPGSVAEVFTLDTIIRTRPVNPSTLGSFDSSWLLQRRQIFRDQAIGYFHVLGSRYQLEAGRFQRAWDRVQRESPDDPAGAPGAVSHLRQAAFPLERSLYRVDALQGLAEEGLLDPTLELTRGYTAQDFFRQFVADRDPLSSRLTLARSLYKTQADRHGGSFPKAVEGIQITYDSAYFH